MTIVVIIFVNSHWCSRFMKETTTPMSLLTHDLEVRSSGSPGQQLFGMIRSAGLEILEAERPVDFARRLQSSDLHERVILEQFLESTPIVHEFQLVALVALAPRLERRAARLGRGRPSDDTVSEVLAHATVALRETNGIAEGERALFVLAYAYSRSRCVQRKMLRHNVHAQTLDRDDDVAESVTDWSKTLTQYFDEAVAAGTVTSEECELIEMTRVGGCSLRQWSKITAESYTQLRMRRLRAEARLRHHFSGEGDQR